MIRTAACLVLILSGIFNPNISYLLFCFVNMEILISLNTKATLDSLLTLYIIRHVCRWGYLTPGAPEWSRGRPDEVHHDPHASRDTIPVSQLELQWHQLPHLHHYQRHWAGTCQQNLIRPSHRVPGAQEPGAGGQWGVHHYYCTSRRAAGTGQDHTDCVRWVQCSFSI